MDDQNSTGSQLSAESGTSSKPDPGKALSKAAIAAEYASLGLSVAGTVSAFVSKQVAYAAAPISVSLFLSLLNRQRLNQQLAQQARLSAQQAQILNQLGEGLEPLQEKVTGLQGDVDAQAQVEHDRPDLAAKFTRDLDQARAATATQIEQLQAAISGSASQAQLAQLQTEFSEQQARLEDKLGQSQSLFEQVEGVQEQFQSYVQSHEAVHQGLGADAAAHVDALSQRLAWLEKQLKPPVSTPELAPEPELIAQPEPPLTSVTAPPPVATLFLNLGIDFGTRYTKVCFQNISDEQSEIIPFRPQTQNLSDALLLSQIGILPDGQLLAGLSESQWEELQLPDLKVLDGLKMRLADLDMEETQTGWRLEAFPELDEPEMVENLCAYYLSRVIQKSQAWVRENRSQLVANEIIGWSANVGVPVAYCDEQSVGDRFKRVLTLAWLLSNQPQTQVLTIQLLQEQMNELRQHTEEFVESFNCKAIPEIGAEAWSFFHSREAQDGYYLFFDIGDGTIDGCAFHFERRNGESHVEFYYAKVCPLGVRALGQSLSQELSLPIETINTLFHNEPHHQRLTQSPQRKAVQQMLANVIIQGGKIYDAHHPGEKIEVYKEKLHVFLGGGGSQIPFFERLPQDTYQEFGHRNSGIQGYEVRRLPASKKLTMNGISTKDFHRFSVAFGLATDYANFESAISLPRQMEREKPRRYSASVANQPIKFEDTKDSM